MNECYEIALNYLTKQQMKVKVTLENSKNKKNVTKKEIEDLENKKRAIDYCILILVRSKFN